MFRTAADLDATTCDYYSINKIPRIRRSFRLLCVGIKVTLIVIKLPLRTMKWNNGYCETTGKLLRLRVNVYN